MFQIIQEIDTSILLFIQEEIRTGILSGIMLFFTFISHAGAIWLIPAVCLMITKKYRSLGFTLLFCVAVSWTINDLVIKNLVMRLRPITRIPELEVLIAVPSSFSFPSGHSCTSFAAAYALTKGMKKYGGFAYIPAVLIALSRVYVGVHYPSDIVFGAIIGTLLAMAAYWVRVKYIRKI